MSSHHIVREKQEPALLIFDLTEFDEENLGQLLEWSPTVIVVEDVYDEVLSKGVKVDFLITDNVPDLQEHTIIIAIDGDPLLAALNFLISSKYPSVNIVTDDFTNEKYLEFANKIDQVIYSRNKRIFGVGSGFRKWKQKGEKISLIQTPSNLKVSGLKEISKNHYQTENDGFYSIAFDEKIIFVAEDY